MGSSKNLVAGGLLCALLACAGDVRAALPPQYHIQNIGVLGTSTHNGQGYSEARAISDNGVVGTYAIKFANGQSFGYRAAVWQNGALQEIGPVGTDTNSASSHPVTTTSSGLVAANMLKYSGTTPLGQRGMLWQDGTVSEMPVLGTDANGANTSKIYDVSNDGLVVGYSTKYVNNVSKGQRGYTWQNGSFTELPTLGTQSNGTGWAYTWRVHPVTNIVIGGSEKIVDDYYYGPRAVTWHNGAITELPVITTYDDGRSSADPNAINAAGTVVGYCDYHVNNALKGFHATRWQNEIATDLGTLGVSSTGQSKSNALGINDAGTIIGNSQKYVGGVDKGLRGVVWENGQLFDVGTLGEATDGKGYSNMWALNSSGQAIGTTKKYDSSGQYLGDRALFFDDGVTTFIDPPASPIGSGFSRPQFITDDGYVFGDYYKYVAGSYVGQYAFAWSKDGGVVDLDSLLPGGPAAWGWNHLVYVSGKNALGQIVGYGIRSNGETQGFVLTPSVPEPTTTTIFTGIALVTLVRRRRATSANTRSPDFA